MKGLHPKLRTKASFDEECEEDTVVATANIWTPDVTS